MPLIDRIATMFGRGASEPAARNVGPAGRGEEPVDVADILAPSAAGRKMWADNARREADRAVGMTRPELVREYGDFFPRDIPGAAEPRHAMLEQAFVGRTQSLHDAHVREVADLFVMKDEIIAEDLAYPGAPVPGLDSPRNRADFISRNLLDREAYDDQAVARNAEEERYRRLHGPSYDDWHEHKAGEPAILYAESERDHQEVDEHYRAFRSTFSLNDPTLAEIAAVAVDVSDRWREINLDTLTSGQIPLEQEAASRLLYSPAADRPGAGRDLAVVEALLDDYQARFPAASTGWERQAREVMAESPEFLRTRYGPDGARPTSIHGTIVREAMREVSIVRAEQTRDEPLDLSVASVAVRLDRAVPTSAPQITAAVAGALSIDSSQGPRL